MISHCTWLFANLESLEFDWSDKCFSHSAEPGKKSWSKILTDECLIGYQQVQCKEPLAARNQTWIMESSNGDIWIGISTIGQSYIHGYGCWPQTAFTTLKNHYLGSAPVSYSLQQRVIILTICPRNGNSKASLYWEFYSYDALPSVLNAYACSSLKNISKPVPLTTYQHDIEESEFEMEDFYFTIVMHHITECVALLYYVQS